MNRRGRGWLAAASAVALLSTACPQASSGAGASGDGAAGAASATASATTSAPAPSASAAPSPSAAAPSTPAASASAIPPAPPRCADGAKSGAAAYAKLFPGNGAHPCMKPSKTFPDLLPVGRFSPQMGCVAQGVIVEACLRTPGDLARERFGASWPTTSLEDKKKQALAFVREIIFPFATILDVAPPEFTDRNHAFSPPLVVTLPNGGLSVTLWLREVSGLTKGQVFTAQQVRFTASGALDSVTQISEWVK